MMRLRAEPTRRRSLLLRKLGWLTTFEPAGMLPTRRRGGRQFLQKAVRSQLLYFVSVWLGFSLVCFGFGLEVAPSSPIGLASARCFERERSYALARTPGNCLSIVNADHFPSCSSLSLSLKSSSRMSEQANQRTIYEIFFFFFVLSDLRL